MQCRRIHMEPRQAKVARHQLGARPAFAFAIMGKVILEAKDNPSSRFVRHYLEDGQVNGGPSTYLPA